MSKTAINYEAGHEYVDLGLSVRWATCNLGAESPTEYGYRFACGKNKTPGYDRANTRWHGRWRIPSEEEFRELIDNCSFEWEEHEEIRGISFTSVKPGFECNSIFLRASGLFEIEDEGPYEYGLYWSSSINMGDTFPLFLPLILMFEKGLTGKGEATIVSHCHNHWASVRPVF